MFAVAPSAGAWIEMIFYFCTRSPYQSLPPRERGLKYLFNGNIISVIVSLPPRERGLKYFADLENQGGAGSLPPRERGLK